MFRHAIVFGRRRQGKSTLALALAIASGRKPVIIFDTCNQYTGYRSIGAEDIDLVMDYPLSEGHISDPIVRIVPEGDPYDEFGLITEQLVGNGWVWAEYTLLIDEAVFLQKPQSLHPDLARFVRQGPDDITVIQTIHRPSECHSTVRALATDIFFFQCYLRRDLDVIRETYGEIVADAVSRLPHHHVLHFWLAPGGEPKWEVWDNPDEWFVPIGV